MGDEADFIAERMQHGFPRRSTDRGSYYVRCNRCGKEGLRWEDQIFGPRRLHELKNGEWAPHQCKIKINEHFEDIS